MTQKLRKHHCFTGLEKLTAAYSSLQYCLHIILSQLKLVNKSGNLNSIMFRGLWFNYLGIQIVVCRLTLSSSVYQPPHNQPPLNQPDCGVNGNHPGLQDESIKSILVVDSCKDFIVYRVITWSQS